MRPSVGGQYDSVSRLPQSGRRPRPERGSAHTRRLLRLTMNGVIVGPPVLQHRPADQQQHPGRGHFRRAGPPLLGHLGVEPGQRSVVPEIGVNGLNHHPAKPPGALLGDPPVPDDAHAALCTGHQTSVARDVVAAAEHRDTPHLGLHEERARSRSRGWLSAVRTT